MTTPESTTANVTTTSTSTPTFTTGTTTTTPTITVTTPPAVVPAVTAVEPEAPAVEPEPKPRRSLEESLSSLDEDTRKYVLETVKTARSEAKNLRERAKSADDVRAEFVQSITKALGIAEEAPDPATLAAQLSEKTAAARQAQVELAVFRAATEAGGNPAALLDSVSFVRSLADVDPSDTSALVDKVKAAITANPALGVAPQRRVPAHSPAAGMSESGAPGLQDQIDAAKKAGDWARVIHLENQKLVNAVAR